jgi:peptidoglycan/LPS O-acetylase OafA/YrhL
MGNYVIYFFLLSGFVIGINSQDHLFDWPSYKQFIKKRLARLYPLHLLTLILVAIAGWSALAMDFPLPKPEHFDPVYLPQNILMIHAWGTTPHRTFNGPSWSISAEWFLYLIFPLLAYLAKTFSIKKLFLVFFVYVLGLQMAFVLAGKGHWAYATYDFSNLSAVPVFLLVFSSPVILTYLPA